MLQYNPRHRPSAAELLKSKIFDEIRVPLYERGSPIQVKLKIYQKGAFDYENCECKLGYDYIKMIENEVKNYKKPLFPKIK
jgi:hypothetical protein